jgi:hypothetical protein
LWKSESFRASEWTGEEAGGHCYGVVRASERTGEEAGGHCYGEVRASVWAGEEAGGNVMENLELQSGQARR